MSGKDLGKLRRECVVCGRGFPSKVSEVVCSAECRAKRVDAVKRLEPDIVPLEKSVALTSIAISMKRIADAMTVRPGVLVVDGPLTVDEVNELKSRRSL